VYYYKLALGFGGGKLVERVFVMSVSDGRCWEVFCVCTREREREREREGGRKREREEEREGERGHMQVELFSRRRHCTKSSFPFCNKLGRLNKIDIAIFSKLMSSTILQSLFSSLS